MATCKVAIVAAMGREIHALVKNWQRVQRQYEGRTYTFFESGDIVCTCAGIGLEAARRAAEAVIALYQPQTVYSVGFAGALDPTLNVGDIFTPSTILDARDGSRTKIEPAQVREGTGTLLTFPHIASASQKSKLHDAYGARAVDMEAAAIASAANKHGIAFTAIKAISDEATFDLPGTERFIDHEGRFHTASFILFALIRPWLWPRIAAVAANSRKAATVLAEHLNKVLSDQENSHSETTLIARRNS
jgi:adenosylhomocysteine nucleosidase